MQMMFFPNELMFGNTFLASISKISTKSCYWFFSYQPHILSRCRWCHLALFLRVYFSWEDLAVYVGPPTHHTEPWGADKTQGS